MDPPKFTDWKREFLLVSKLSCHGLILWKSKWPDLVACAFVLSKLVFSSQPRVEGFDLSLNQIFNEFEECFNYFSF